LRSQHPKHQQEQPDIHRGRSGKVGQGHRDRPPAVAAKPGQHAHRTQANREDHQQQQPTDLPGPEAGPLPARDVPELGHGVLGDLGQAPGTHAKATNPITRPTPLPRSPWRLSCPGRRDGEVGHRRAQQALLEAGVAAEQEPKHGDHDQQQGKHNAKKAL